MATTTICTTLALLVAAMVVGGMVMAVRTMVEGFNLIVGVLFNANSTILGVTPVSLALNV